MTRAMTTTAMPQPATRGSYPATTTNSAATSASSSTVVLSRTTSRPRCDVPYMGLAGVGSGGSHGDGRAGPTISFSGQPTLVTPATPTPSPEPSASPPRWTAELEERLRWAQRQLEEHQKRWSEGQDEYFEEVSNCLCTRPVCDGPSSYPAASLYSLESMLWRDVRTSTLSP